MPYVGAPRPPTTLRFLPTTKTPSACTLPSTRAAPGTVSRRRTSEAGTVRVDGSPLRVVLPAGRTTTSPTDAPNSLLNPSLSAAEKTREPTTKATPSAIAKVLISRRTLRASRLFHTARSTSDRRFGGSHPGDDLLALRIVQLVDDATVGEEDDAVGVGRRRGVVGHHHHGLGVLVHAPPQQLEDLGARPAVEVPGRLVGEHDLRPPHQRPGHGDPLLLSAGQLVRPVPEAVPQPHGVD